MDDRYMDLFVNMIDPMGRGRIRFWLSGENSAPRHCRPANLNAVQWSNNSHPLSEFPLVSPIAGTLIKRDLRVGGMVNRNDGTKP
jgi:hypothetical protein